jgi:predicted DNA-binding protein (MmcQ/YjbR family)
MSNEWLDSYLLEKPGAEKDFKVEWEWFRYQLRGKLFAAVCTPDPNTSPTQAVPWSS